MDESLRIRRVSKGSFTVQEVKNSTGRIPGLTKSAG